jgi:hypothetical protein
MVVRRLERRVYGFDHKAAIVTALVAAVGFAAGARVARAEASGAAASGAAASGAAASGAAASGAASAVPGNAPSAGAPGDKAAPGAKTTAPAVVGAGELAAADRALLNELLAQVGARGATLRSVERTPERQVAVMVRLAQEDLAKAKLMYCSAGDRVLDRFDAKASVEHNQATMLTALMAVLPDARGIGCLNHIRNPDVLSVDIKVDDVPEAKRATFVKAAEAAVTAGKIARFLAPPREPDAFHFEFKRRTE